MIPVEQVGGAMKRGKRRVVGVISEFCCVRWSFMTLAVVFVGGHEISYIYLGTRRCESWSAPFCPQWFHLPHPENRLDKPHLQYKLSWALNFADHRSDDRPPFFFLNIAAPPKFSPLPHPAPLRL